MILNEWNLYRHLRRLGGLVWQERLGAIITDANMGYLPVYTYRSIGLGTFEAKFELAPWSIVSRELQFDDLYWETGGEG